MMKKRKEGFTLAELLVVVAIIAILVAVSIPIFTGRLEAAKEATCLANRRSLKAVMVDAYLNAEYEDLQKAFGGLYHGKNEEEFICPKKGLYTWEGSENSGYIKCSVHDGGDGGGASESKKEYFPDESTGIEVWDTFENVRKMLLANPNSGYKSGVFKENGEYYISIASTFHEPSTDLGALTSKEKVIKLTGEIVTYGKNEYTKPINKGDIALYNGEYYVSKQGGWTGKPESGIGSTWHKIPKTRP